MRSLVAYASKNIRHLCLPIDIVGAVRFNEMEIYSKVLFTNKIISIHYCSVECQLDMTIKRIFILMDTKCVSNGHNMHEAGVPSLSVQVDSLPLQFLRQHCLHMHPH